MTDMIEARAAGLADQPLRLASPQTGFASGTLQSIRDIAAHRELLGLLISRELKARYKDSSLGFIWSLIRPLVMLLIYYVALGQFLGAARGIPKFAIFIYSGLAAWTLVEYLVHRFAFHHRFPLGRRLHQLHHDHPSDPDAERTSLTTPLVASPFALVVLGCAGMEDGSSIFAGLLAGYLIFIAIHYAVHRLPIEPGSWLYPTKIRHLAHHRFDNCNFGVTTGFWDIVFRTRARSGGARSPAAQGAAPLTDAAPRRW